VLVPNAVVFAEVVTNRTYARPAPSSAGAAADGQRESETARPASA
jgi:hypothetical protein